MALKNTTRSLGVALGLAAVLSACTVPALQSGPMPVAARDLLGVQWVAVSVDGVAPLVEPKPQLRWSTEKLVVGTGGCNQFFGQAALTPDSLRIGPLAATGKACMTAPGGQEDLFFRALELTRSARMERGQLELLDASGKVLSRLATVTRQP